MNVDWMETGISKSKKLIQDKQNCDIAESQFVDPRRTKSR